MTQVTRPPFRSAGCSDHRYARRPGSGGTPVRAGWISERFGTLAARAGLPPVRFHDLRHGSASMLLAAGNNIKVVSEIMGHATSAFTADVYVTVTEELAEAAATSIAAFVPRKGRASHQ